MTVGEFIDYVKEHNIPEDYEICFSYFDESDYGYGIHSADSFSIDEVKDKEKEIIIDSNLITH